MTRILLLCLTLMWLGPDRVLSQQAATVIGAQSGIEQNWRGHTMLTLTLSRGVPFRVFTLNDPARLVIDFRDLDSAGVNDAAWLTEQAGVNAVRFGTYQPGWSRLLAELTRPMLPDEIGMAVDDATGHAVLTVRMIPAEPEEFDARSGVPQDALWPEAPTPPGTAPFDDGRFVVAIDPGHGGIDPGAERKGVQEKHLMLEVANSLRRVLQASGDVDVILTRESDHFVSLDSRVAQAHQAGADLFLSLHADALSQGGARGATVYTLSDEASDTATAHLAARHNRADVIAGVDLTGADDEVATVLLDLARQETAPRAQAFAQTLVDELVAAGGPVNRKPLRNAGFSVLKSADIPSVLLEVGFLSSERDLNNILDPVWREKIVQAVAAAILTWQSEDADLRARLRQ